VKFIKSVPNFLEGKYDFQLATVLVIGKYDFCFLNHDVAVYNDSDTVSYTPNPKLWQTHFLSEPSVY
jgi:hypothetical protein